MGKRRTILVMAVAATLLIGGAAFFRSREAAPVERFSRRAGKYVFDQVRKHWGERIGEIGGLRAFAELKAHFDGGDPLYTHGVAHAFGESLYKVEGIGGLRACDAAFAFGCFHGFIVTAMAGGGEGSLRKINDECVRIFGKEETGCRHGIGHGVMEFFGKDALADALDYCDRLQTASLLGCTHGAFMEYMSMDGSPMTATAPDEPCASVDERYRPSCYFQLPNWWQISLNADYAAMGAKCAALADAAERDSCLLSVGKTIGEFHKYDLATVTTGCALMPSDDAAWTCRAGAYWLAHNMVGQGAADPFCATPDAERQRRCVEEASAIEDPERWQ